MFGEGISKAGEIIDLGVDFEIIKKAGSWFSYGDTKLGQGRDGVKQLLLDNPDLMDELEAKIKATVTADHLEEKK
jgi:recombination protein RecA